MGSGREQHFKQAGLLSNECDMGIPVDSSVSDPTLPFHGILGLTANVQEPRYHPRHDLFHFSNQQIRGLPASSVQGIDRPLAENSCTNMCFRNGGVHASITSSLQMIYELMTRTLIPELGRGAEERLVVSRPKILPSTLRC